MSEAFGKNKKQILKDLIRQLHAGANPDEVKEKFRRHFEGIGSPEIAQIEEELIKEGMPVEEIHRLCDIHLAVFRESLEKQEIEVTPGHPIHTFMEEHKIILQFSEKLKAVTQEIKQAKDFNSVVEEMKQLKHITKHLMEAEKHYVREENVLFPYLEKHGITGPPAIMWSEHTELRENKKKLHELVDKYNTISFQDFVRQLEEVVLSITSMLSSHVYKENNILYPTALSTITEDEWKDIREECDDLGYCCFTPEEAKAAPGETRTENRK